MDRSHPGPWHIRPSCWLLPVLAGTLAAYVAPTARAGGVEPGLEGVRVESGESPDIFCHEDPTCLALRWVWVGLEGLDHWVGYDPHELRRALTPAALLREREVSLAVRLLVAEVGADRLVVSENALRESVGILYTVDNRLDPTVWNPLQARVRPFDGCEEGASFASCANRFQYNGMGTWRALDPASRYDPELLARALDVAVAAWVIQERGVLEDFTGGATNYVHRCGGTVYGATTWHCDGTRARGIVDPPGAEAHSGPILFRAPYEIAPAGYYRMRSVATVDYQPRHTGALDDELLVCGPATAWSD